MINKKNIRLLCLFAVAFAVSLPLVSCAKNGSVDPTYKYQEFDPNETPTSTPVTASDIPSVASPTFTDAEMQILKDELPELHAALEQANAEYESEWENEKNRLLAELDAKDAELKAKTPPELDFKSIAGMYEAKGELSTLTYSYEVTVEITPSSNFLTDKKLVYIIPGKLKIGVNFDAIKNGIVEGATQKTVTVTIPKAYVIANETDDGIPQRYDVNKGVFSTFSKAGDVDYKAAQDKAKLKAEEQVQSNGMLNYAQNLAGLEILGILEPITSKSGYQIVVVYE